MQQFMCIFINGKLFLTPYKQTELCIIPFIPDVSTQEIALYQLAIRFIIIIIQLAVRFIIIIIQLAVRFIIIKLNPILFSIGQPGLYKSGIPIFFNKYINVIWILIMCRVLHIPYTWPWQYVSHFLQRSGKYAWLCFMRLKPRSHHCDNDHDKR